MCANLFNDPEFNPSTIPYPDLHPNFVSPIYLSQQNCPNVTPEKVKSKIADSRAKVALLANAWHQSGNGDSQLVQKEGSEKFAHFDTELIDGDDRASFLPVGGKPHHLYMWSLFDEYQILHYTMAMLPHEFACSGSHVPMTSGKSLINDVSAKKRKKEIEEITIQTQKAISESISSLAKSGNRYIELQQKMHMDNAQNQKKMNMDNAEIKYLSCDDSNLAVKNAYKKQYDAAVADYNNFINK